MAHVADHLSVSALEQQYRSCKDVTAARHCQTIWLLANGHDLAQVSATVSFARRWVERLRARYNAHGPQALGDLRRRNGTSPSILRPDLLEKLKVRLLEPPPDGGLWTSRKWRPGWRANSGSRRSCRNLGAQRPAADRARSPPLQVVVRHRLRAADL